MWRWGGVRCVLLLACLLGNSFGIPHPHRHKLGKSSGSHVKMTKTLPSLKEVEAREQEIWHQLESTTHHHTRSHASNLKVTSAQEIEAREKEVWAELDKPVRRNTSGPVLPVALEDIPITPILDVMRLLEKDPVYDNEIRDLESLGRMASSPTESAIARILFLAGLEASEHTPTQAELDVVVKMKESCLSIRLNEQSLCSADFSGPLDLATVTFDFSIQAQAGKDCSGTIVEFSKKPQAFRELVKAHKQVLLPTEAHKLSAYEDSDYVVFRLSLVESKSGGCSMMYEVDGTSPGHFASSANLRHAVSGEYTSLITDRATELGTKAPADNTWTHVQIVHQGTEVEFFADGVLIAESSDFPFLEWFGSQVLGVSAKLQNFRIFSTGRVPTPRGICTDPTSSEREGLCRTQRFSESCSRQLSEDRLPCKWQESSPGFEATLKGYTEYCVGQFEEQGGLVTVAPQSPSASVELFSCCFAPNCEEFADSSGAKFKKIDPSRILPGDIMKPGTYREDADSDVLETAELSYDGFLNLENLLQIDRLGPMETIGHAVDKYVDLCGGTVQPELETKTYTSSIVDSVRRCLSPEDSYDTQKHNIYKAVMKKIRRGIEESAGEFNLRWNFPACKLGQKLTDETTCRHPVDGVVPVDRINVCDYVRNDLFHRKYITTESVAASRSAFRSAITNALSARNLPLVQKEWLSIPRSWVREQIKNIILTPAFERSSDETQQHALMNAAIDMYDFEVLLGQSSERSHISECEWSLLYSFMIFPGRRAAEAELDVINLLYLLVKLRMGTSIPHTPSVRFEEFQYLLKVVNIAQSLLSTKCKKYDERGECVNDEVIKIYGIDGLKVHQGDPSRTSSFSFAENVFRSLACLHEDPKKPVNLQTPLSSIFLDRRHLTNYFLNMVDGSRAEAEKRTDTVMQDFGPHDRDSENVIGWEKFKRAFYYPADLFPGIQDEDIIEAHSKLGNLPSPGDRSADLHQLPRNGYILSVLLVCAMSFRDKLNQAATIDYTGDRMRVEGKSFPEYVGTFAPRLVGLTDFMFRDANIPTIEHVIISGADIPKRGSLHIYVHSNMPLADLVASYFKLENEGAPMQDLTSFVNQFKDDPNSVKALDILSSEITNKQRLFIHPCKLETLVGNALNVATDGIQPMMCAPIEARTASRDWIISIDFGHPSAESLEHRQGIVRFEFKHVAALCGDSGPDCNMQPIQGLASRGVPFSERFDAMRRESRVVDGTLVASGYRLPVKLGANRYSQLYSVSIRIVDHKSTPDVSFPNPSVTEHNIAVGCIELGPEKCPQIEIPADQSLNEDTLIESYGFVKCPDIDGTHISRVPGVDKKRYLTVAGEGGEATSSLEHIEEAFNRISSERSISPSNPFVAGPCRVHIDFQNFIDGYSGGWATLKELRDVELEAFVTLIAKVETEEPELVEKVWHTRKVDASMSEQPRRTNLESSSGKWDECVNHKMEETAKCRTVRTATEAYVRESALKGQDDGQFSILTFNIRAASSGAFAPRSDDSGMYYFTTTQHLKRNKEDSGITSTAVPFLIDIQLPDYVKTDTERLG